MADDNSRASGTLGDPDEVPVGDAVEGDVPGEQLGGELLEAPAYEVAADELEAEELAAGDVEDDTPDKGDPEDVEIDDVEQLTDAELVASSAPSTRPVKRNLTVAPTKKASPTPKQQDAKATVVKQRTTPVMFAKQSAGELRKVKWPSSDQLWQYFVVVLVFVLLIMTVVSLLDLLFGTLLLKWLG